MALTRGQIHAIEAAKAKINGLDEEDKKSYLEREILRIFEAKNYDINPQNLAECQALIGALLADLNDIFNHFALEEQTLTDLFRHIMEKELPFDDEEKTQFNIALGNNAVGSYEDLMNLLNPNFFKERGGELGLEALKALTISFASNSRGIQINYSDFSDFILEEANLFGQDALRFTDKAFCKIIETLEPSEENIEFANQLMENFAQDDQVGPLSKEALDILQQNFEAMNQMALDENVPGQDPQGPQETNPWNPNNRGGRNL